MRSIFYDLETTSKHPIGQILNYCFTLVDSDLKPVKELAGRIRISRLELPSPGAIAANRTDVLEHQATTTDTEAVAARKIVGFINEALRTDRSVNFIGFNSAKFDLNYLRTTLIRNGLNPYFSKRLVYRDLLHVARKLSCTDPSFPRVAGEMRGGDEAPRLSLSLQTLSRACGVLAGDQRHEAREDVHLTIALARHIRDVYHLDVTNYTGYEAAPLHRSQRTGEVYGILAPRYELAADGRIAEVTPMTLLDGNDRGALWIDLKRFREGGGRDSIRWFSPATAWVAVDPAPITDRATLDLAHRALGDLADVSLTNYFGAPKCDIEQHIYQLDMSDIDALRNAIEHHDVAPVKSRKFAQILFNRQRMIYGEEFGEDPGWVDSILQRYAVHRYGGQMVMVKGDGPGEDRGAGDPARFHQTYRAMLAELAEIEATGDEETKKLMGSLRKFYEGSDIVRVAGAELAPHPDLGPDHGRILDPRGGIER